MDVPVESKAKQNCEQTAQQHPNTQVVTQRKTLSKYPTEAENIAASVIRTLHNTHIHRKPQLHIHTWKTCRWHRQPGRSYPTPQIESYSYPGLKRQNTHQTIYILHNTYCQFKNSFISLVNCLTRWSMAGDCKPMQCSHGSVNTFHINLVCYSEYSNLCRFQSNYDVWIKKTVILWYQKVHSPAATELCFHQWKDSKYLQVKSSEGLTEWRPVTPCAIIAYVEVSWPDHCGAVSVQLALRGREEKQNSHTAQNLWCHQLHNYW